MFNFDKLTKSAQKVFFATQELAVNEQNSQITPQHFLYAML